MKGWRLDPLEVMWDTSGSSQHKITKGKMGQYIGEGLGLVHIETGLRVSGVFSRKNYSRGKKDDFKSNSYGFLFAELEAKVAKKLRIRGFQRREVDKNAFEANVIFDRLKEDSKATANELATVRAKLKNPEDNEDIYSLLGILGLGTKPTQPDIALMEKHLMQDDDDWVIQGAIHALCDYWGLTKNYLDRLLFVTEAGNWEYYSSAAIASFSSLGRFLYKSGDPSVCTELLVRYDKMIEMQKELHPDFNKLYLNNLFESLHVGVEGPGVIKKHIAGGIPEKAKNEVISKARKLSLSRS